ncbi:MAG: Flp pilus assembly complex ATPase component TadA [Lachnospiraceae bacterium]|nr:Flp pilus assembly complex ATPase component TadA [Lachnospiraceae bacterium]
MEFAKALGVKQTEKHDGYIEGYSDFFGCTIWITWAIGHLVTLSYPETYDEKYKNWNMADLPFLPEKYLYEVIPSVKKQFQVVKKLLNSVGASEIDKKEKSTLSEDKKFLVPSSSLRMRPDRIIVGEVRDGAAFDFLQAANTGHDGSLCTGHANSAEDMISRLEMMTLMGESIPLEAIRRQIASAVDIIIHLGRLKDKSRKVLEITELSGFEKGEIVMNPIYKFDGETLRHVGELKNCLKLERMGL